MKSRKLRLSGAKLKKPGSAKHAFGHRSHISGKRAGRFAAQLKDNLVAQAKQLEAELVKK